MVVLGFSNGGLMANALACRAADRIRAVALIAPGHAGRCDGVRVRLVRVDDDTHGWPALEDANERIAAFLR